MKFELFIDRLKSSLDTGLPGPDAQYQMAPEVRSHPDDTNIYHNNARKSAVLILFYQLESINTLLIQRSHYEGVHSGQIAFPGGAVESGDIDLIETALREAEEEVGVPRDSVNVLGTLTELYIPPSNFLVLPVVGVMNSRPNYILDEKEVKDIIEVQVETLTDEQIIGSKEIKVTQEIQFEAPYYQIEGRTVWGATAMMISELNAILKEIIKPEL